MSLWAPKYRWIDSADGDEAESVRARLRERVSSPWGEDGEVEPAGHHPQVYRPIEPAVPVTDSEREGFVY